MCIRQVVRARHTPECVRVAAHRPEQRVDVGLQGVGLTLSGLLCLWRIVGQPAAVLLRVIAQVASVFLLRAAVKRRVIADVIGGQWRAVHIPADEDHAEAAEALMLQQPFERIVRLDGSQCAG